MNIKRNDFKNYKFIGCTSDKVLFQHNDTVVEMDNYILNGNCALIGQTLDDYYMDMNCYNMIYSDNSVDLKAVKIN